MSRVRQFLILGIGTVVLIVGVSLVSSSSSPRNDPGSTSNGKPGTLAIYTWMSGLGFQTSRIEGSFDLHNIDTLMMLEPTQPPTSGEISQIDSFLRDGGNLVVADGSGIIADQLLEKYKIAVGDPVEDGTAKPDLPLNSSNSIRSVPMLGASAIDGNGQSVPLLELHGSAVAVGRQVGAGRIYFVSSEQPFDNDGLRHDDSAAFDLSLVSHSRGGRIGFDEFHHGSVSGAQVLGMGMDQVFTGPLGLATFFAVLLVALYLFLRGRHLGTPAPRRDPALVPSAVDRLDALAQLVARAGDKGAIARAYAEELKTYVGAITGASPSAPDADFTSTLAGGPAEETKRLLAHGRLLEMNKPSERQLVAYARDVIALESRWSNADSV